MQELLAVPDDHRDEKWEDLFLQGLCESHLRLLAPDPKTGPDGWPYLMVETCTDAKPGTTESAQKILHWLSSRGIGLVINPQKDFPDFILSYGMLWGFRESGKFIDRQQVSAAPRAEKVQFAAKHTGAPTAQFLPDYVRKVLRDFFRDQGILAPRTLCTSEDGQRFDLAFSLESLGNPPESEWAGIGEALSWFLPPHYSVLLISEKGLPAFVAV